MPKFLQTNLPTYLTFDGIMYGAVVCIVKLVDIERTTNVREILCERERIFGNYEEGRYAWFLELIEKFDSPIPAKGNRMIWNWNAAPPEKAP
jgi:hypothetical protein